MASDIPSQFESFHRKAQHRCGLRRRRAKFNRDASHAADLGIVGTTIRTVQERAVRVPDEVRFVSEGQTSYDENEWLSTSSADN